MKVNFFTPITFENGPRTTREKWTQRVDDYFFLGGKKAVVLNLDRRDLVVKTTLKQQWYITALKVFSYATIIIPLIALIAKYCLRKGTSYSEMTLNDLRSQDSQLLSDYENSYKQELTRHLKSNEILNNKILFEKVVNICYNSLLYVNAKKELNRTERQVRAQTTQAAHFAIGSGLSAAANFVASAGCEALSQATGLPILKPVAMLAAKPAANLAVEPVKRMSRQAINDLAEDNSTLRGVAWKKTLESCKDDLSHDSTKVKVFTFLKTNYPDPLSYPKYRTIEGFEASSSTMYNLFFSTAMCHRLAFVNPPFIADSNPENFYNELLKNQIEPSLPDLKDVKSEFDQSDLTVVYSSSVGSVMNAPKRISQAFTSAASSAMSLLGT
jgi:hypothetical protein